MLAKIKSWFKKKAEQLKNWFAKVTIKLTIKQTILTFYAFITKRLNNKQVELYLVKNTDTILTDLIIPIQ